MSQSDPGGRGYDLEDRTFRFAVNVRTFVRNFPKSIAVFEDAKQLVRSSGSVGANYIEANEHLGERDLLMRLRICKKEAKESIYWLRLLEDLTPTETEQLRLGLIQEAKELVLIFAAMIRKRMEKFN